MVPVYSSYQVTCTHLPVPCMQSRCASDNGAMCRSPQSASGPRGAEAPSHYGKTAGAQSSLELWNRWSIRFKLPVPSGIAYASLSGHAPIRLRVGPGGPPSSESESGSLRVRLGGPGVAKLDSMRRPASNLKLRRVPRPQCLASHAESSWCKIFS